MSQQDSSGVTYTIADDICQQTGITAKWINEDKLAIYAYNHITTSSKDKPSPVAAAVAASAASDDNNNNIQIHHLETEFIFQEPILRSLVAEASSIFKNVQEVAAAAAAGVDGGVVGVKKSDNLCAEYLNLSKTYRSAVRACLEKLQELLEPDDEQQSGGIYVDDQLNRNQIENYITIFYSVECFWHLCEILMIDQSPAQIVVPQLLDWIRFHYPKYERRAAELLFTEQHDDFEKNINSEILPVVKGLIAQGQVEVARTLLLLHSDAENSTFQIVGEILKSMPIYNVYGCLSLQKFRSQWQYWVTDTESKLATGCLANDSQLETIVKLVTGDQQTWIDHAVEASNSWYEYLPGYLFYSEPACKYFELGNFADNWLRRWAHAKRISVSGLKHLDRVIFKIMENDMHQVIHDCQNMCDSKWFVTHLTDLLYHCGRLEIIGEQQINVTSALRESLLFDFGAKLMSRSSMWLIGIDYLEHSSGDEGIGAIQLLLPRIPIENEHQALKILNVAKTKGLTEIEREICKIQSMKSLKNNRMGNALEWAIRSNDNIFVTSVADKFLNHYAKTGEMLCHDVLAYIGAKMFISPRLVFLVKYFDFQEYYKCCEFPQAAELLVDLLDSKITPEYFWPSLLADTIPLLESKEPQFSSKETYIILQHLEMQLIPLIEKKKSLLATGKSDSLNLLNDCRIENIEDTVRLIRLACARNLARALIIENTVIC